MIKLFLITFTVMFLLSSCTGENSRDVEYYRDHPQEMKEKVNACRNDPGKSRNDPNCINALEAEYQIDFGIKRTPKIKK